MLNTQSQYMHVLFIFLTIRVGFPFTRRFSHAADAFENCDPKFKAVFAEPKSSARGNTSDRSDVRSSRYDDFSHNDRFDSRGRNSRFGSSKTTLNITCSHMVIFYFVISWGKIYLFCFQIASSQLWRLFDIIPGLVNCEITGECNLDTNL